MKTSGIFVCFFNAAVLSFLGFIRHRVDSALVVAPEEVTAAPRGSVTVSCQYDLKFSRNTKYWCRGPVYERCAIVVKTARNRPNERYSITDDKEAGVFTVTMTSLTESDEDTYWCVIAQFGRNEHAGVRVIITHTATIPTTTSLILEKHEISLWAILRWILLFVLLCCLPVTHMAVRRIRLQPTCRPTAPAGFPIP